MKREEKLHGLVERLGLTTVSRGLRRGPDDWQMRTPQTVHFSPVLKDIGTSLANEDLTAYLRPLLLVQDNQLALADLCSGVCTKQIERCSCGQWSPEFAESSALEPTLRHRIAREETDVLVIGGQAAKALLNIIRCHELPGDAVESALKIAQKHPRDIFCRAITAALEARVTANV